MARVNVPAKPKHVTHEGAPARRINAEQQLRRSVCSCLLWEKEFYEDGQSITARIAEVVPDVRPEIVGQLAVDAREKFKLRHVPLLLVREMARYATHRALVGATLSRIIQRPDELSEFVAIYWGDNKQPLSAQVKKGLASAFTKFSAYQLAKYNRDGAVKLRDVLFLCHAKPKDEDQGRLWKSLVDGTLQPPDTWEVGLSAGQEKKETWERLMAENKLGGLALLRNLRNMESAGVDRDVVRKSIESMKTDRILPYRFIAAARYASRYEPELEAAMLTCMEGAEKLPDRTILLVDVSGSMQDQLSKKSDLTRLDAACGLAIILREICEKVDVLTFSAQLVHVPARRGFALRDAIVRSQPHASTYLGAAVTKVNAEQHDRLIVITDEQSHYSVPNPKQRGYMLNVASAKNGVGYGPWIHVDGFSESVVNWIIESEE